MTTPTPLQRLLLTVLPKAWSEDLQAESQAWKIRCGECGTVRSVWEAGGVRWKARSQGKRTLVYCPKCGEMRPAVVEKWDNGET